MKSTFYLFTMYIHSQYALNILKHLRVTKVMENLSINFPVDPTSGRDRHTMFISNDDSLEQSQSLLFLNVLAIMLQMICLQPTHIPYKLHTILYIYIYTVTHLAMVLFVNACLLVHHSVCNINVYCQFEINTLGTHECSHSKTCLQLSYCSAVMTL